MRTRWLSVDGRPARLLERGAGPPVVLVHGLGLSARVWAPHLARLSEAGFHALAPGRAAAIVLAAPTGRAGWHALRQPFGLAATALQEPPGLVAGVVKRYLLSPMATLGTWLRAMNHVTVLDAPRIACAALLVVGERDAVVPERFVALLERLLRDVETLRIPGASHAVALDPVDPFCDAVLEFLDRRYSRGRITD